jgi:hypothetical protein
LRIVDCGSSIDGLSIDGLSIDGLSIDGLSIGGLDPDNRKSSIANPAIGNRRSAIGNR